MTSNCRQDLVAVRRTFFGDFIKAVRYSGHGQPTLDRALCEILLAEVNKLIEAEPIAFSSTANRTFPTCKDHKTGNWNEPTLEHENDNCILCRLFYLEAQEELLEEWQQRAKRAEDALDEVQRPLDAQMARLNETVTRLNTELEVARSASAQPKEQR